MIRENGTSTIIVTKDDKGRACGVEDSESGLRIRQIEGTDSVTIRDDSGNIGIVIDCQDVGNLRDCLTHMLDVLALPATN